MEFINRLIMKENNMDQSYRYRDQFNIEDHKRSAER